MFSQSLRGAACATLVTLLVGAAAAADQPAPKQDKVVRASSFGFDPDDATRALQAAINSGARKVIVDNPGKPWIVTPLTLASNQELFFEKGVEVLAKKGAFKGGGDSLFHARCQENITLRGYDATLRMRRADYDGPEYKKAEWRHVLCLQACKNVQIYGLTLTESGGDGIYLGAVGALPCKDILVKDVVCDKNYRQGISVISAENLLIEDCVLSNTGGTPPAAGIDFEPNRKEERLVNCTLRRCLSKGNDGGGFALYLPNLDRNSEPLSIRFEDCRSIDDKRVAVSLVTGNTPQQAVRGSIMFSKCLLQGATGPGIQVRDKPVAGCALRFENCTMADVAPGHRGPTPIVFAATAKATEPVGGVQFTDCIVRDQRKRNPIAYVDSAGVGLKDVTGNLILEKAGARTNVILTPQVLAKWIPALAIQPLPRLPLAGAELKPQAAAAKPDALAKVRLRQECALACYAKQGDAVQFRVRYTQFAAYNGKPIVLAIRGPSGAVVQRATLPFNQETEVQFQAPATGLYRLNADAGVNCLQVLTASHPLSLDAEDGPIHLLGSTGTFYFWAPAGTTRFGVRVCGDGAAEGVKAALVNPRGEVVEEHDDITAVRQFEISRPATSEGEIWGVRLSRPKHVTLEDHFLDLRGVPPLAAGSREGVLVSDKNVAVAEKP